jgi:N-acetylmuramoyl-L-alanine amidase
VESAAVIRPDVGYFQAADMPVEAIDGRLDFWKFGHKPIMRYTGAMRYIEMARYYIAVFIVLVLFGIPAIVSRFPAEVDVITRAFGDASGQLAAVILAHSPKSIADILSRYSQSSPQSSPTKPSPVKVRVLIVPGHEPDFGGAEYGSLKERDMTVELGQDLLGFLQNDGHYQAFITRDTAAWSPAFASYFASEMNDIALWQQTYKRAMSQLIALGSTTLPKAKVFHVTVPSNVALRLYGITKWANENDIDITIHIHFNDYPGHGGNHPGKYSGFVVYVPVSQYENSTTTHAIADTIFKRLAKYNKVSDLPGESLGIIDDPELIAVGANDSASLLIEYAYIYEPQFTDPVTRSLAIKDLAYQTYLGLEDFFSLFQAVSRSPL